jgi:hypothetical protein
MHLVLPFFSLANLFINYYHKHPDSHAAAGRDCVTYKKNRLLMRLDERGMRDARLSSPMPHYTI